MYIPESDRLVIEQLLQDTNSNSIQQLMKLVQKYGADTSHGCFCKESAKIALLNKIRDWYISNNQND